MEKFKQILNKKINDRTAAFSIGLAVLITWITAFGIVQAVEYQSSLSKSDTSIAALDTSANLETEEVSEQEEEEENQIDEEEAQKENEEEYEKLVEENQIDESAADKYYIKVNYGAQVVTVYKKDSNGDYTVPVKAMVCSTGTYTPTSGVYRTLGKGTWWKLVGDVYGQYSTWICGDILFHSVPYLTKGDKSSLEYWAYDQLGERVSLGCVRLTVADAKWIYDNCSIGTQVEFYSSSDPGPLGKPTARKISSAPSNIRGWDPTDPDSDNPWPEYLKSLENSEDEDNSNKTNSSNNSNNNNNKNEETTENPSTKPEDTKEEDDDDEVVDTTTGGDGDDENNNTTNTDSSEENSIDEENIINAAI